MSESDSIDRIVRLLRAMNQDDVVDIGHLPATVALRGRVLATTRLVITAERRDHALSQHPEMAELLPHLVETLIDPFEIHWDKNEPETTATFWRPIDPDGSYWIRASVRLAVPGENDKLANSLITAWRIRRRGYLVEIRSGRRIWWKEKS